MNLPSAATGPPRGSRDENDTGYCSRWQYTGPLALARIRDTFSQGATEGWGTTVSKFSFAKLDKSQRSLTNGAIELDWHDRVPEFVVHLLLLHGKVLDAQDIADAWTVDNTD